MSRQYFYWRVISEGEARANRQLILTLSSHTNIRQAESLCFFVYDLGKLACSEVHIQKNTSLLRDVSDVVWELTDSNRRPSACKADALNQLS